MAETEEMRQEETHDWSETDGERQRGKQMERHRRNRREERGRDKEGDTQREGVLVVIRLKASILKRIAPNISKRFKRIFIYNSAVRALDTACQPGPLFLQKMFL